MVRILMAASIAVALCSPASAEVYRCDDGGSVSYQEAPCAQGGEKVDVRSRAPEKEDVPDCHTRDLSFLVDAKAEKSEVLDICGQPKARNRTVTANGSREQWVYRIGRASGYIYFTNGVVDAVQD